MANNSNNTNPVIVQAEKAGDWVLPVTVNGTTVYALQINKSKEDKENIETLFAEYAKAGVEIFTYKGKNNSDVYLVDATKKIKAQRTSVSTENLIAEFVAMGLSEEQARQAYANAKAKSKKQ